jgi:hypothetical protein
MSLMMETVPWLRSFSACRRGGIVECRRTSQNIVAWRSLGETKGTYKKANKTGTNQLGCFTNATTSCYHPTRSRPAS